MPPGYLISLDEQIKRLINSVYRKKPTDKMLAETGMLLAENVQQHYNSGISVNYTIPDAEMLTRLTLDVWQFSAAKNYHELRDLTLALVDDDGKQREFKEFEEVAKSICEKYNKTWLQTEYNFSIAASQNAARWNDFVKEQDTIPNLEYQTVGDSSVRESHAILNGTIRPVDDEFWRTYYPPNGWGCRCEVVQTLGGMEAQTVVPSVPIPELFRTNLAQSGLIYPRNHPYYNGVPQAELRKSITYLPPDNTYLDMVIGNNEIEVHPLHGQQELGKNLEACNALFIIDPRAKIKLLPVINEHDNAVKNRFYPKDYLKKYPNKNADLTYNGKVAEIETPSITRSSIQNAIRNGKKQADWVIIHVQDDADLSFVERVTRGQIKHYKDEKLKVWIVNNTGNKIEI